MRPRRRFLASICLGSVTFAVGSAGAQPFDLRDGQGRVVHFDAPDAASALQLNQTVNALTHGREVSTVTIRVLSPALVAATCGTDAAGCYQATSRGSSTIFVPTGGLGPDVLTHEYGHHIERSRRTSFTALGSGMPAWWRTRGVDGLLQAGQVARDYSLGWDRSIAEIYAEDFAVLNGSNRRWRMQVGIPGPEILAALRTDLAGAAPTPPTPGPAGTPAVSPQPATGGAPAAGPAGSASPARRSMEVRTRGLLAPGHRRLLPFTVPGPGNGIVVGIRLAGRNQRASARADIRCAGKALGGKAGQIKRPISFRIPGPGAANCVLVVSRASAPVGFSATIRVTPPSSA